MNAEVRVRDTVVTIADAGGACPAFAVWLYVYVPDVDETYRKARAAGGVDPDKRGGVKDPCGNAWWISTKPEEIAW